MPVPLAPFASALRPAVRFLLEVDAGALLEETPLDVGTLPCGESPVVPVTTFELLSLADGGRA